MISNLKIGIIDEEEPIFSPLQELVDITIEDSYEMQKEREELMRNFKSRNIRVLVGTDVLSRGIDVEGVSLVINYDAPHDPEDYIHRIGRTARAEESGVAITLITQNDFQRFQRIEKLIGKPLTPSPLPEHIGLSPEFNSTTRSKRPQRKPASKGNNASSNNRQPKS